MMLSAISKTVTNPKHVFPAPPPRKGQPHIIIIIILNGLIVKNAPTNQKNTSSIEFPVLAGTAHKFLWWTYSSDLAKIEQQQQLLTILFPPL